jgi:hypothetical protein
MNAIVKTTNNFAFRMGDILQRSLPISEEPARRSASTAQKPASTRFRGAPRGEESFFFLISKRGEISRFARNDGLNHFLRAARLCDSRWLW